MGLYVQKVLCEGISVVGDYLISDYSDHVIISSFFDRSKAKAKAIACCFGRKPIRYDYNNYKTKDCEYRIIYKPFVIGRDRAVYTTVINKKVGKEILCTTQDTVYDDFYNLLLNNCRLPLLKEWIPYLYNKMLDEHLIFNCVRRRHITDEDRQIYIGDRSLFLRDIMFINVENVTDNSLGEYISEGLRNKSIKICEEEMKPLEFTDFDDYISKYGSIMVKNLEKQLGSLIPLKGEIDEIALKSKRLYPQQAACVNGIVALKESGSKYALAVEGMGCGKTVQGATTVDAIFNRQWLKKNPQKSLKDAFLSKEVNYRVIGMMPSHLVYKWRDEVLAEIPGAKVQVITSVSDLIKIRDGGKERAGKEFYFLSKDYAKLGASQSPIPTSFGRQYVNIDFCADCYEAKGTLVSKVGVGNKAKCPECGSRKMLPRSISSRKVKGLTCPNCSSLLLKPSSKMEDKGIEELILSPADFATKTVSNSKCYHCGEPLWGDDVKPMNDSPKKPQWYKINHFKNATKKSKKSVFVLKGHESGYLLQNNVKEYEVSKREYGPRKTAPAQYIKKYLKGYFDVCILDECHKYENGGTAQANAASALISVSDFTIGLTGTLSNGKADSFFYLFWMLDPERMRKMGYSYDSVTDFVKKYGSTEAIYELGKSREGEYNVSSRGRTIQSPKTKPGISPLLFSDFLIDKSVFLDLSDLSKFIPPLKEEVVLVPLPSDVESSYRQTIDVLKASVHSADGMAALTSMLQFGLSYPDKPYGRNNIMSARVEDMILAHVDNYDNYNDTLLPKEEKLVEIINQEISNDRNCFVYATYTNNAETNVIWRLKEVIEKNCNLAGRVCVLEASTVEATEREAFIKQKASEGIRVFITNPKCVETGLDFCFNKDGKFYNYPTLIFYQITYELSVIWQASRRHYRLNQTKECHTYWLAYENTLQSAALEIMAEKQVAASAIQGKFSAEGLANMASGVDPRVKLAQKLSEGDNSSRKTLENMFDALNKQSAEASDDNFSYIPPKLYSEVVGEEETVVVDTTEKTTQEDFLDIFDLSISQLTKVVIKEELMQNEALFKKPKKAKPQLEGQLSFFDLLAI